MQATHLVDKTRVQHRLETRGDGIVQAGAVVRYQGEGVQIQRQAVGRLNGQMFAQRPARQHQHFQRPLDALAVGRLQTVCGGGIGRLQTAVERGKAVRRLLRLQLRPHRRIGGGQIVQPARQRVEIHHRATDNQRQPPARGNLAAQTQAVRRKLRRAVRLQRRDNVDQMVRHGGQLGGRRLGRADVHAFIDQRGIEADDFNGKTLCQPQRKAGFAGSGGPEQGESFGKIHIVSDGLKGGDYSSPPAPA